MAPMLKTEGHWQLQIPLCRHRPWDSRWLVCKDKTKNRGLSLIEWGLRLLRDKDQEGGGEDICVPGNRFFFFAVLAAVPAGLW